MYLHLTTMPTDHSVTWTDDDGGTHTVTGHPDLVAAFLHPGSPTSAEALAADEAAWLQRIAARTAGDTRDYTCPRCGMTSHHPTDAAEKYCGHCHRFEQP